MLIELGQSYAIDAEFEFTKYIAQWNKQYSTREEFDLRLSRWLTTNEYIEEVNAPGSGHTHTAGHNHFSDWTQEEIDKMFPE